MMSIMKRVRVKYARNRQVLRRYELDTPRVPCPSLRGRGWGPARPKKAILKVGVSDASQTWVTVLANCRCHRKKDSGLGSTGMTSDLLEGGEVEGRPGSRILVGRWEAIRSAECGQGLSLTPLEEGL